MATDHGALGKDQFVLDDVDHDNERLTRSEEFAIGTTGVTKPSLAFSTSLSLSATSSSSNNNNNNSRPILGRKLGEGQYCTVHEVLSSSTLSTSSSCTNQKHISLALKQLRQDTPPGQDTTTSMQELTQEAETLSSLRHNHIVRVHSMAFTQKHQPSFYFLMDRLEMTLADRLLSERSAWKNAPRPAKLFGLRQRLSTTALPLAAAILYLHQERRLVHRDVKASNVGFDRRGVVKLFDFGFCATQRPGRYLRGAVGTVWYMAPEMLRGEAYDMAVDVYSFGLLLWEICAMETAFGSEQGGTDDCTAERVAMRVLKRKERPRVKSWWPKALQSLLKDCWAHNPQDRPSMGQVKTRLCAILAEKERRVVAEQYQQRATSFPL